MSAGSNAPVIIKRKKVVGGDGHHGGAWKVAYADFVTAMMAFFMLMWLLNATTETQRKGIADYFSPTIPVNRISGGGDGAFGGDSVFSEDVLARSGSGASNRHVTRQSETKGQPGHRDAQMPNEIDGASGTLAEVEKMLSAYSGESMVSERALRHIVTRVTDEGLIVELFDTDENALFLEESDEPTELMLELADIIAELFALVRNDMSVGGHTRAHAIVLREDPGWDLSTRRAHRVRQLVEASGFPQARVKRVTGFADRNLIAKDPMAVRNNRIELTLLRSDT